MKPLYFLLFLFFISFSTYCQQLRQYSYLTVRIQAKRDEMGNKFYRILPEDQNPNSAFIDSLVKYSIIERNKGTALNYASMPATTNAHYFNFFKSISAALEFLDAQGWRLLTVVNDISGYSGTVNTETTYYFRKESK